MSEHFNQLTPQQAEALALLLEACGEVVQAVGKALRHGLNSTHPDGGLDNRALIEREAGDVAAAVEILVRLRVIHRPHIEAARVDKLARVERYLHHIALNQTDGAGSLSKADRERLGR
jgi:NTP pyrophosphatase (non-canonical NTP hydrolase)